MDGYVLSASGAWVIWHGTPIEAQLLGYGLVQPSLPSHGWPAASGAGVDPFGARDSERATWCMTKAPFTELVSQSWVRLWPMGQLGGVSPWCLTLVCKRLELAAVCIAYDMRRLMLYHYSA